MQKPKLLDQIRMLCMASGYSPRTGEIYAQWAKTYILFHNKRHPSEMGKPEAVAWLADLAGRVARPTLAQARAALRFLYRRVLGDPACWLDEIPAPRVVPPPIEALDSEQMRQLLTYCTGAPGLALRLMAGAGLRLAECEALQLADVDLKKMRLRVNGKGGAVRLVPLPASLAGTLAQHLEERRAQDLAEHAKGWSRCRWLFVGWAVTDDENGKPTRQALPARVIQRQIEQAREAMGLRASCHTLRHSYATGLAGAGVDVRSIQRVLGHADIRSTARYLHQDALDIAGRVDLLAGD
jgi:integrase